MSTKKQAEQLAKDDLKNGEITKADFDRMVCFYVKWIECLQQKITHQPKE